MADQVVKISQDPGASAEVYTERIRIASPETNLAMAILMDGIRDCEDLAAGRILRLTATSDRSWQDECDIHLPLLREWRNSEQYGGLPWACEIIRATTSTDLGLSKLQSYVDTLLDLATRKLRSKRRAKVVVLKNRKLFVGD